MNRLKRVSASRDEQIIEAIRVVERNTEEGLIAEGLTPLFVSKAARAIAEIFETKEASLEELKNSTYFTGNHNVMTLGVNNAWFNSLTVDLCAGANVLIGYFMFSEISKMEKMQFNKLKDLFLARNFPVIRIASEYALEANGSFFKQEKNVYTTCVCLEHVRVYSEETELDDNNSAQDLLDWYSYAINFTIGGLTKINENFDANICDIFDQKFTKSFCNKAEYFDRLY